MAKKPAIQAYAADMDVTPVGSTEPEAVVVEEEIFMSESTKAELAAGAARLAALAAVAVSE